MIRKILRYLAHSRGKAVGLYRSFNKPGGREWADYLRRNGRFYRMGRDCTILPSAVFTDPPLTMIGDRVCMGACRIICHDGSIEMLEQAYGVKLDRVGSVVIEDDVYIGEGAMIIGSDSVTVGARSIIGAGAIVRSNVPPGSVVVGNPAKVVAKVEDVLRFWEADFMAMPWKDLIISRHGAFDADIEPELCRVRQEHFFKKFG